MYEWLLANIFLIMGGFTVIGTIFAIGNWVGVVNSDRKSFKEFMTAVNERIDNVNEAINSLSEKINSLSEKINSLSEKINSLSEKINNVNEKINNVNEKINNVNKKIDEIINRLPPNQIVHQDSPIKLTSFGAEISNSLSVKVWAESQVLNLFEKIKEMQPFEISEKCEKYVEAKFEQDENLQIKIRKGAYEHGASIEEIQTVYQVELRDALLQSVGQSHSP